MNWNIKLKEFIKNTESSVFFIFVFGLYCILTYLFVTNIETPEALRKTYSHLSVQEQNKMIKVSQVMWWAPYVMQFLYLIVVKYYNSLFVFLGFKFQKVKIEIKNVYKIVLIAEIAYVAKMVIAYIFLIEKDTLDLHFARSYTPFSINSFISSPNLQESISKLLGGANLFLVLYIIIISYLLSLISELKMIKAIKLIVVYYGIGYLIFLFIEILLTTFVFK